MGPADSKNTSANASTSSRLRSERVWLRCCQAARRRLRTESPLASSTCGCRSISRAPHSRNEPTSTNSAHEGPAAATSTPPSAGPATNVAENATLSAAFARRSASSASASRRGGPQPARPQPARPRCYRLVPDCARREPARHATGRSRPARRSRRAPSTRAPRAARTATRTPPARRSRPPRRSTASSARCGGGRPRCGRRRRVPRRRAAPDRRTTRPRPQMRCACGRTRRPAARAGQTRCRAG